MMIKRTYEGLRPWWETRCPGCCETLTFLDGADIAFCSWPTCRKMWDVDYSDRDWPTLTLREEARCARGRAGRCS